MNKHFFNLVVLMANKYMKRCLTALISGGGGKSLQSCLLLCYPMDSSLPGFSVPGILQAGILEWVAISSSRGSSWPRDQTHVSYVSCIGRWVLYHWHHLGSPLLNILMVKCFLINFLGNVSWIQWALFSFFYLLKISRRP